MDVGIDRMEQFPADYKFFKDRDNLKLQFDLQEANNKYYTVVSRGRIFESKKQDTTNWLISSGGNYNMGNMSKFFEAEDNVLYILALRLASDRDVELEVRSSTGTGTHGIIKNDNTIRLLPSDDYQVTLFSFGTTYIPTFTLYNNTEYTPVQVDLYFKGWKYYLRELESVPETYDTIDMRFLY